MEVTRQTEHTVIFTLEQVRTILADHVGAPTGGGTDVDYLDEESERANVANIVLTWGERTSVTPNRVSGE